MAGLLGIDAPHAAWATVPLVNAGLVARNLARNESRRIRTAMRDSKDRRGLRRAAPSDAAATVVLHFADDDPHTSMYQVRQWYKPLAALHTQVPVAISVRSATAARIITDECSLPVAYLRNTRDLERYMESIDPRVVLYVNHWARNFQVMRYGRAMHVFISHGESEKIYMASGQLRAYDFAFIAGPAAHDRILAALPNYDPAQRTRQIGRPQLDFLPPDRSRHAQTPTVLYAPTYEGDRPSMAYGSVESHGVQVVGSLIGAGYRVIYRPHPMTGTLSESYRRADHRVRDLLRRTNAQAAHGGPHHVIDASSELDEQMAESAVAIVDNSAMAFDWLVTGKPLVVTIPDTGAMVGVHNSFLSACYRLTVADAGRAAELVANALDNDTLAGLRAYWIARHFGDLSQGASTKRFIGATAEIVAYGAEQVRTTEQRAADLSARSIGPRADER
jgi:hypothetical protein